MRSEARWDLTGKGLPANREELPGGCPCWLYLPCCSICGRLSRTQCPHPLAFKAFKGFCDPESSYSLSNLSPLVEFTFVRTAL